MVRSQDGTGGASSDSMMGANDTAVAHAADRTSEKYRSGGTLGAAETSAGAGAGAGAGRTTGEGMAEIIGATLSGRYLVTRKVGQGGMGAVYEATHTLIGKRVAVKVLLEKYAQREAIVQRLEQEARLASSIGNEHIIDITDFGKTEDGRTFVVMEFLEGESLAECLTREVRLPEQRLLRMVQQTSSALAAAHAKGIVHRDIKPENLFLLRRKDQDFVKVVDFGISKSLRASSEEDAQPRLTQTGMVLGTPLYMSPEQARGDDELDARVDIYALGVIMYEASTGRVPFAGNNYLSVISQVLNETPKSPRELRPDLSDEFEAIVMKAMEKDKHHRYASATDMLADVNAVLEDPTHSTERAKITGPRKRPKKGSLRYAVWIGAVALALLAVVMLVKMLMGDQTKQQPAAGALADDAGVALASDGMRAVPADVAVAPEVQTIMVKITSTPSGAEVFVEGASKGRTPIEVPIVLSNKEVNGDLSLAGYNDQTIKFNPVEVQKQKEPQLHYKLRKPKAGAPIFKATRPGAGSGATQPVNKNPDLGGYPGASGGTVP
ncbi:MAG: serine/threonine protein kinase [Deltaproteobacteria bacterium]|nr:serine/threonine protein kinase [Deltaproteobacteria bacterium]